MGAAPGTRHKRNQHRTDSALRSYLCAGRGGVELIVFLQHLEPHGLFRLVFAVLGMYWPAAALGWRSFSSRRVSDGRSSPVNWPPGDSEDGADPSSWGARVAQGRWYAIASSTRRRAICTAASRGRTCCCFICASISAVLARIFSAIVANAWLWVPS